GTAHLAQNTENRGVLRLADTQKQRILPSLLLTLVFPRLTIHLTWRALAGLLAVKWSTSVSERVAQHSEGSPCRKANRLGGSLAGAGACPGPRSARYPARIDTTRTTERLRAWKFFLTRGFVSSLWRSSPCTVWC